MQCCSEITVWVEADAYFLLLPVVLFNGAKAAMYAPQVSVSIHSAPDV